MPRANRYILPGHIYHLTHRCHDRRFLLRFARDRNGYRRRLREAILDADLSLLDYIITSNHVHLIVYADEPGQVARLMQQAAGEFARDYNRRKRRSGAFWEGRYFATMIDSGDYLWQCLCYLELNMPRCGAVKHPREWAWSGYEELMGLKNRNRLLDIAKLLWLLRTDDLHQFRSHFQAALEEKIRRKEFEREARWTEALAVGSHEFICEIADRMRNRQSMQMAENSAGWVLQEMYSPISPPENQAISHFFVPKSF